jgi:hypothetical protein
MGVSDLGTGNMWTVSVTPRLHLFPKYSFHSRRNDSHSHSEDKIQNFHVLWVEPILSKREVSDVVKVARICIYTTNSMTRGICMHSKYLVIAVLQRVLLVTETDVSSPFPQNSAICPTLNSCNLFVEVQFESISAS